MILTKQTRNQSLNHRSLTQTVITFVCGISVVYGPTLASDLKADAAYWGVDCDGDGHVETVFFDFDGDREPEQLLVDLDGDISSFEIGWFDRQRDGSYSRILSLIREPGGLIDTNDDKQYDTLWLDRNGDMRVQSDERSGLHSLQPLRLPPPCNRLP